MTNSAVARAKSVRSKPAKPAPTLASNARTGWRDAANVLRMAGDSTRLAILDLADGRTSVGGMCAAMSQSQPAVSHHICLLRHAGLVEARRDGKENYYTTTAKGARLVEAARALRAAIEGRS